MEKGEEMRERVGGRDEEGEERDRGSRRDGAERYICFD